MKRALITLLMIAGASVAFGQNFLLFEFMKVEDTKGADYWEVEKFWSKIHQERVKAGDIAQWDLWSLNPGGQGQGHQYLTVHSFKSAEDMMSGGSWSKLMERAKAAYPKMSEDQINQKLSSSASARDIDVRYYVSMVDNTDSDPFPMDVGMVVQLDLMKVDFNKMGAYEEYHKVESEVFKPNHQKMVDADAKLAWGLGAMMSPTGSDAYATHMTWNMFKDWSQYLQAWDFDSGEPTPAELEQIKNGLATRDMKWSYLCTLQMTAQPE